MWTDMEPPAEDVILVGWTMVKGIKDRKVAFCVDRLPDAPGGLSGTYRATVGNLFGSEEVLRHPNLDHLLRLFTLTMDGMNPARKLRELVDTGPGALYSFP